MDIATSQLHYFALKVINKLNGKLRFLYRKNRYILPYLKSLLCNAIIRPHIDYACSL